MYPSDIPSDKMRPIPIALSVFLLIATANAKLPLIKSLILDLSYDSFHQPPALYNFTISSSGQLSTNLISIFSSDIFIPKHDDDIIVF
jgi:hypothetical protein